MPERKRQLDRIEANDNSANYLKAVLDSSQHGIMAFSSVRDDNDVIVDFRWELVNRVSEMLTGRTANDLNGKHLLVEMPGNAEDGLFDQYVLVVETGIPLDIEHYYEHEGIKTWFHITACKMMYGFVVTFANITEQKNLQEELEQKYRELDEFFHVTPDMLCIADLDGTFLKVNHAWEKALGYTREELEGKPFLSFVHPDDVEKTIQAVAQLENGQAITQFQNRYRHANGSYRILDWHTSPNPNGKIGYSAARDVTADQAMIAMLENSEKRFSLAFHNSPVAMVMTSRTEAGSVFMDANQAYLDLIGYEWHEIAGETTQSLNLSIEGTSSAKRLHLLDTQGEYNKLETVLQVRDGTKHHILGSGQRSMMYDTPIDIDILLDITDRKRAAAQAFALKMEKARSELLTDFIQNSSHEFRTPLAIIKTSMYLLSRTQDEAKQQRHIGVIDLQIEQLLELVDGLQKMSKVSMHVEEARQSVCLASMLGNLVQHARETMPDTMRIDLQAGTHMDTITANERYLSDALWQIIENAIRFGDADNNIFIQTAYSHGQVMITISDSGMGINQDDLPRIFEHFYRVDVAHTTPGLGLGLALSKTIIENHGGTITVQSNLDTGSTFTITLPTAMQAVA